MAKSWILALVCFFGLAMSAQATNRAETITIIDSNGRQRIVLRQKAPPRRDNVTIIRNGLFGLRRTVIVR